jgi:hypothetical protein
MATQAPGTGLAIFDPKASAPAHIAQFFDAEGTNIQPRTTVPSLSITGKVWTISIDGQKSPLQARNQDGDLTPLPVFKGVILDFAKERGRAYYDGEYDPNNVSAPACWSDDGVAPDASLPGPFPPGTEIKPGTSRKINHDCATCQMAVKGSKVIPGTNKAVTACAQHKMLAVLPDPAMKLPAPLNKPLRLKIAMTSIWDKQSPDQEQQGWLAFDNYVEWINARGVKHTAGLVTKMKFDATAAYPKIFFGADRYLEADELAVIAPLVKAPEVRQLLGGTWTPAGADGVPKDQQHVAQPQPAGEPPASPSPAAAPAPEYRMADGETHTREQYHQAGWTDDQLIASGKLIAVAAPPAAPAVVAEPAPPPAPVAAPAQEAPAVVVAEPALVAAAPVAEAAVVVVTEPETSAPLQPAAPTPEQAPAQAAAPPPAAAPQAPEPPAAAAAAAAASPAVSTNVPADVGALLEEWGDAAPAA